MYNKQGAQAYSHIMLQAAKKYALQVLFPCRPFPKGLMPRQASLSAHGPLHARPYRHPGHPQDKRGGPSIAPEPHSPRRSVPAAGPLSAPRPSRAPSAPRTAPRPRCPSAAPAPLSPPRSLPGSLHPPQLGTCQQRGLPLGRRSPSRSPIGGTRPRPPGALGCCPAPTWRRPAGRGAAPASSAGPGPAPGRPPCRALGPRCATGSCCSPAGCPPWTVC